MKRFVREDGYLKTFESTDDPHDSVFNIKNKGSGHFISKEHRDEVAKLLTDKGVNIKKRNSRNIRLHPEYIEDFEGNYETGFGNTDYEKNWNNIYDIEII